MFVGCHWLRESWWGVLRRSWNGGGCVHRPLTFSVFASYCADDGGTGWNKTVMSGRDMSALRDTTKLLGGLSWSLLKIAKVRRCSLSLGVHFFHSHGVLYALLKNL